MAGLHDVILLVDGYSAMVLLFVESDLDDGRFESSSISLHASYRSFQLG